MSMRPPFIQAVGSFTSSVSAIAAWQEHVDWLLRVGASTVAIFAGLATLYSVFRSRKNSKG